MRKLLLCSLVALVGGCNWWYNEVPSPDDLMHVIPWFDHMIASKAVHPYQSDSVPRNTPPGTVPIGDVEGDWGTPNLTGALPVYGFDLIKADLATRPSAPAGTSSATPRNGQELFQTYCAVCHGPAGNGQGLVKMGAPALTSAQVGARTDGFIYSVVRYGRNLMPPYGDKIVRREERWAVVDYVRSLQGTVGAAPGTVPPPGGTN